MQMVSRRGALNLIGLLLLGCSAAWLLLLRPSAPDTGLRRGTWLPPAATTTPSR